MKKHISLSILATSLLLIGCGAKQPETLIEKAPETEKQEASLTPEQLKNGDIQMGTLEQRTMSVALQVNGQVEVPPQNLVSVSFPMGGYLKESHLLPGSPVRKGEVIAELEDPRFIELQQEYLVTQSQLRALKLEYDRQQSLIASKATSEKALEQSRAAHEAAQVTLAALRGKLGFLNINPDQLTEANITRSVKLTSPINGYVTAVHANVGKYVAPTDVLFELVNPADLHLALTVFERDLTAVAVGQKVKAWQVNSPSRRYEATIILAGKMLDQNRATEVHCHFDENHPELIPGMYMTAEVNTQQVDVPALPLAAVVQLGKSELVFVEKTSGVFEPLEVTTGTSADGWVQIATGAEQLHGKRVVTQNAYTVLMKMENVAEEE